MITARSLVRIYRLGNVEVRALRGVSFEIGGGEFVGIMGPSGSGKSTLLHILGLLDHPTSGDLAIDGINVLQCPERRRTLFRLNKLGYVFQDYALVPELTARENVYLPSMVRGMPRDEYMAASAEILGEVGLGERMEHRQYELSGGEQQRVAIARAIAKRPAVLLCDEPTGALDSLTGVVVLEALERVNRELGTTTAVITHNVVQAGIAERIVHLSDGLITHVETNERRTPARELTW